MPNKYKVISLFAGAGGMDMGFHNIGFDIIWANDFNHDACETHKLWSKTNVVEGDISKIDMMALPDCDVIIGGFPCQGFSLAGPRKIDDSRNTLYKHFVKLVNIKKPKIFVAENVRGLLTLSNGEIADAIINDFSDKGYNVEFFLKNVADYGVPQDRYRVIIVGIRKDINAKFILPEPYDNKATLYDALKDMDEPCDDEICNESYSSRYMSRNRKRGWNEQSFTIPAMAKQVPLHPSSPDMVYIEKDKWKFGGGKTRRLSYKECAAIQTFPKDMVFVGNLTSKYKQIGNAVPVKFAEVVATEVKRILDNLN